MTDDVVLSGSTLTDAQFAAYEAGRLYATVDSYAKFA
jgi:hypothetical protein